MKTMKKKNSRIQKEIFPIIQQNTNQLVQKNTYNHNNINRSNHFGNKKETNCLYRKKRN